jgi:hypothetical protein
MATALLSTILISAPADAKQDWNHPMSKNWYIKLARCETSNNTRHSTRSYVTAFGIYRRTWDYWNNTPNRKAHLLTFAQQARGVDRIAFTATPKMVVSLACRALRLGCYKEQLQRPKR